MPGALAVLCAVGAIGLTGCGTWQPSEALVSSSQRGDFQVSREVIRSQISTKPTDRNQILDRVRLGMADLADGQIEGAESPFLAAYDLLRMRGVNEGVDARIFFSTEEDEKNWKGDPFEIAAAYAYFSAQLASVGDWGSARAAAGESLFLLADFEAVIEGDPGQGASDESDAKEDKGYQPVETNFAPGYFMAGLASYAMSKQTGDDRFLDEARDQFRKAARYAPGTEGLARAILEGQVNTVLWVDWGKGPEKIRLGNNAEFSEYRPMTRSGQQQLSVSVNGSTFEAFGPAADFNEYALDHRWRNSQGVRVAKAALGEGLVIGGAVVAHNADDTGQALVGLAAMLIGSLAKESAQADVRHNELIPQRGYFVGLWAQDVTDSIELMVEGVPGSRLVLTGLGPRQEAGVIGEPVRFRYVRLIDGHGPAPSWATSGRVYYANDEYPGPVTGSDLPYILGGRCVRSPTERVFAQYEASGLLPEGMTLIELRNLYRAEGLTWELTDQGGLAERHLLEGGRSLVAPAAGTTGFARIFGQLHGEYVPRSGELLGVLDGWDVNARWNDQD
ncbi:MAG: hypothetical protein ACI89L_001336 [Phycisphaerales bacterium]